MIRQVREHRWRSGFPRAIAVLRWHPNELALRSAIEFFADRDDLDELLNAYLVLPSGETVALRRHNSDASPGTTVLADSECVVDQLLSELIWVLDLRVGDVAWRAVEVGDSSAS